MAVTKVKRIFGDRGTDGLKDRSELWPYQVHVDNETDTISTILAASDGITSLPRKGYNVIADGKILTVDYVDVAQKKEAPWIWD